MPIKQRVLSWAAVLSPQSLFPPPRLPGFLLVPGASGFHATASSPERPSGKLWTWTKSSAWRGEGFD